MPLPLVVQHCANNPRFRRQTASRQIAGICVAAAAAIARLMTTARQLAMVLGFLVLPGGAVLASPGCDAVNGNALTYSFVFSTNQTGKSASGAFWAGDKIMLSVSGPVVLRAGSVLKLSLGATSTTHTDRFLDGVSLTLTANGTEAAAGWDIGAASADGRGDITASCIAATPPTGTTIRSSINPSLFGQAVSFTATVSSPAGTPSGTVTFFDNGVALGTGTLINGAATFVASSLAMGSHSITASYGGATGFPASSSPVLSQVVQAGDSPKLRALQIVATQTVAQVSGQAIADAAGNAVTEGFGESCDLISPSSSGLRFNLSGIPDECRRDRKTAGSSAAFVDPASSVSSFAQQSGTHDRVAIGPAPGGFTKAPSLIAAPREWLAWADVREARLERSGSLGGASLIAGDQVNALLGITRKLRQDFLIGAFGGYESFDYRSDALNGRLKGDGWTVGSYLGWMIAAHIRFDASAAYSGIGYDGAAGLAAGSFSGRRWLASSGLTGTYQTAGFQIEPSARLYALWEREDAYNDTLGTLQTQRSFASGRASGGVKLAYPLLWLSNVTLAPYAGIYADYHFNNDTALASSSITRAINDGWAARAVGGMTAKLGDGGQISLSAERGGIGGHFELWTYRARASMAF